MNKLILAGYIVEEPKNKSNENYSICEIKIATRKNKKSEDGKQQYSYFYVTFFGKVAEIVLEYLTEKSFVIVEGRIENNQFIDKQMKKQYRIEVIGEKINFTGASIVNEPKSNINDVDEDERQDYEEEYNDSSWVEEMMKG